ncbi:hypothetical protein CC78DRAFT_556446 [Lojkania enalia]|uniref:Uncharacterized protein n=1 Tax=Lojkania enalia TaxID=147567 RepID=A0A9P4JWR7_9PLEO|nr:hypothetical protein CC78DRAFT_556446 [Didymosphaeria enalia]
MERRRVQAYLRINATVDATLIFAQEGAVTAVCISEEGPLICPRCVTESEERLQSRKSLWLLFASGLIIQANRTAERETSGNTTSIHKPQFTFLYIMLSFSLPNTNTPLLYIRQPELEDLEIGRPGVATGYDVLHISEGKFHGHTKGQDRQDNSEIGALKHDCWAYWGHSGAPLVERVTWCTGIRRGIGIESIREFLDTGTAGLEI